MAKKYIVDLTEPERADLRKLLKGGKAGVRRLYRARVLLLADEGATDERIAGALYLGKSTVERTRRRFVEGGVERALTDRPRPGKARLLNGKQEAFLVALACSDPPPGRERWTMQLLADRLVELKVVDSITDETVRRTPKKNDIKPWQKKHWCIPNVSWDFVCRMEDVLDLYQEPYDPLRPVVCFDEVPYQLIGETRTPVPAASGRRQRVDYEYRRCGTANLFIVLEPKKGWRRVNVTERRTNADFARQMKDLVDVHYPHAEKVRVVLDNLSSHSGAALYETFEPEEARRIFRKLEFHYTPKHGSWLNMAEIEISVLGRQCLNRRIDSAERLRAEILPWETGRNANEANINWRFTVSDARGKLGRLYAS
ncbi:MAG TPA: IS630 family transposase [Longimicrobiales bacterium]|nr:IS630 family transposase [Longimicrobiales bacterium]